MKARIISVRLLSCLTAMLLCVAFFSLPSLASEKARPISSLSADERNKLPDNTEVTLKTGQTVTLGTLRAEHRARMERFAKAAELGRMVAGKLKPHNQGIPMSSGRKTGSPITGPDKPVVSTTGRQVVKITPQPSLVPFKMPAFGVNMAKDYVDFCKAANPSACLYLPANTTLKITADASGHDWGDDFDYLITDRATCEFDGGIIRENGISYAVEGCDFYYPVEQVTNFIPTGPLYNSSACDAPANYILDPKGAVKVAYPHLDSITIRSAPVTCVVQVWIESK